MANANTKTFIILARGSEIQRILEDRNFSFSRQTNDAKIFKNTAMDMEAHWHYLSDRIRDFDFAPHEVCNVKIFNVVPRRGMGEWYYSFAVPKSAETVDMKDFTMVLDALLKNPSARKSSSGKIDYLKITAESVDRS